MKNKKIICVLCCIALLIVSIQVLAGCNSDKTTENESTENGATESSNDSVASENKDLMPLTNDGKSMYCVVYDPQGVEKVNTLATQIVSRISEITEFKVDFRRYSSNNISDADGMKRIYVGAVGQYTDTTYSSLRQSDFRVDIIDGDIILGGYSYDKLYLAQGFFLESLVYIDGELYVDLSKADIGREGTYAVNDMKVGNTPIDEYSIVYGNVYALPYAERLAEIIGTTSGYVIPVVSDEVEECENEFLVGITSRNPDDIPLTKGYSLSLDGSKVKMIVGDDISAEILATYLLSKIIATDASSTFDFASAVTELNCKSDVRMMTYNVLNSWGEEVGARGTQIANLILRNNLDIVCLQEYDVGFRKSSNNLQDPLKAQFEEVTVVGVDQQNIWNPIFYNKDKYELVESGMVDMYAENVNCAEYTYPAGDKRTHFRTLVWAVLKDKATDQCYIIGNLHYSVSSNDPDGGDHKAESNLVMSKITDVRSRYADATVLIAGDYNSNITSGGCGYMINAGYANTLLLASVKGTNDKGITIGKDIDNILTIASESANLTVRAAVSPYEGNIVNMSDHLPVVIQFEHN